MLDDCSAAPGQIAFEGPLRVLKVTPLSPQLLGAPQGAPQTQASAQVVLAPSASGGGLSQYFALGTRECSQRTEMQSPSRDGAERPFFLLEQLQQQQHHKQQQLQHSLTPQHMQDAAGPARQPPTASFDFGAPGLCAASLAPQGGPTMSFVSAFPQEGGPQAQEKLPTHGGLSAAACGDQQQPCSATGLRAPHAQEGPLPTTATQQLAQRGLSSASGLSGPPSFFLETPSFPSWNPAEAPVASTKTDMPGTASFAGGPPFPAPSTVTQQGEPLRACAVGASERKRGPPDEKGAPSPPTLPPGFRTSESSRKRQVNPNADGDAPASASEGLGAPVLTEGEDRGGQETHQAAATAASASAATARATADATDERSSDVLGGTWGNMIKLAVARFEAEALERIESLAKQTWAPLAKRLKAETDLSLHINSTILSSLDLDSLSTKDLQTVLSLSEEIRNHRVAQTPVGSQGGPTDRGAPACLYTRGGPPCVQRERQWSGSSSNSSRGGPEGPLGGLPRFSFHSGHPADQRGPPREAASEPVYRGGLCVHRSHVLDAIDERDGFADIFKHSSRSPPEGPSGCCSCGCEGPSCRARGRPLRPFGCVRMSSSLETAAAADFAAAAAQAAEFMDPYCGRGSPSRASRRRGRGGPQRTGAFREGPQRAPQGPEDWQPPMKRYARGGLARRGGAEAPVDYTPEGGPSGEGLANPSAAVGAPCAASVPAFSVVEAPLLVATRGGPRSTRASSRPWGRNSSIQEQDTAIASSSLGTPSSLVAPRDLQGDVHYPNYRSPVKGVYFDSFKKLWRVQWHSTASGDSAPEGKRMSRSFSCTRLGFDVARARAVAWMVSGGLVGDAGPLRGCIDSSGVYAALAEAESWGEIEDCQLKEVVLFWDPRRFLHKIETHYAAQKLCGGPGPPSSARGSLPPNPASSSSNPTNSSNASSSSNELGSSSNNASNSSNSNPSRGSNNLRSSNNSSTAGGSGESETAAESKSPSPSLSPESLAPVGAPVGGGAPVDGESPLRASVAAKTTPRRHRKDPNRQKALTPISLDEMLDIVWGPPQDAAACIGGKEERKGEKQEGTVIVAPPERTTSTPSSTTTSAEYYLMKSEASL